MAIAIQQVIPILRIFDVAKAKEFYLDFLGFHWEWGHRFDDTAPLYAQVSRAGCVLHLSEHYGDCCPGAAVHIVMTGIEEFHQELTDKKYGYLRPGVKRMFYGALCMEVIDPFGNRLRFNEMLEPAATAAS